MALPEVATDYERVQSLAKERASLEELVEISHRHEQLAQEQKELDGLLQESSDQELVHLAKEELESVEHKLASLTEELKKALLPKDPNDDRDVIVEIRSGTGGGRSKSVRQRPIPGLFPVRPASTLAGRRDGLQPLGPGRIQQDRV